MDGGQRLAATSSAPGGPVSRDRAHPDGHAGLVGLAVVPTGSGPGATACAGSPGARGRHRRERADPAVRRHQGRPHSAFDGTRAGGRGLR